jgi:ATP-dependent Lhr-like helicase
VNTPEAVGAEGGEQGSFARLHPAVQHHVVNTLGWHRLRPHQEDAIAPILDGAQVLVQAPTAGGKTESAVLPLLSRMLEERWGRPSVLYLCPIKALLNNLESRLALLSGIVGRTVGVWHGDVSQSARNRILRERPDILLATPESIEVMLVSRRVDHRSFLGGIRAVVIDEVHAFAGDDRGWHLLALLERLSALAREPLQRIALSATLSNPEELLHWLVGGRDIRSVVVRGTGTVVEPDLRIDYVGSLENAATVISRLHQGEKRLVFCDSRRQVEELGQLLRSHGTRTFVSHSSLGVEERREAEAAFSQGSDCVIVATSTLELGIDVGDLDRVIQVNAPATVAGFLQRLGRTGRRAGAQRNCLFLATSTDGLLQACGLVGLWSTGYVEPVVPPPVPFPVMAQQLLAMVLQEAVGIERSVLHERLAAWCRTADIRHEELEATVEHLLATDVLFSDGPLLGISRKGERRYGARHFLELFSVFNTPPLVTVYHGLHEVGQVHPTSFRRTRDEPTLLTLAGRGWRVTHLDLERKRAWVEPADLRGRSRWLGSGAPMHFAMAQAIRDVLLHGLPSAYLSRRAQEALAALRSEYAWVGDAPTVLMLDPASDRCRWWSFAGDRYNQAIAERIRRPGLRMSADGLGVTFLRGTGQDSVAAALVDAIRGAQDLVAAGPQAGVVEEAVRALKFAEAVPTALLERLSGMRYYPAHEAVRMQGAGITIRKGEIDE